MQTPLSTRDFIKEIWKWKACATCIWVTGLYLSYFILVEFFHYILGPTSIQIKKRQVNPILSISPRFYLIPLALITASLPLYFYAKSLTIIPIRPNVLSLRDVINPLLFLLSESVWLFFQLFVYFDNYIFCIQISFVLFFILLLNLDFTIYYLDPLLIKKTHCSRFSVFFGPCIRRIPLSPILISFFVFTGYYRDLFSAFFVALTICISFAFAFLCSLIVGEKTSFAGVNDASRLYDGIAMNSQPIVQYWAYSDLLDICFDEETTRRNFLFSDKTGNIGLIINAILEKISNTAEKHEDLSGGQINYTIQGKTKKQTCINLFRLLIINNKSNTTSMMKEKNACKDSIIVIYGIMSLERLLSLAPQEDHLGIVQHFAEKILDRVIRVYWATERTAILKWKTPAFWSNWIVQDYAQLTRKVLTIANVAIENMTQQHGNQFDLSLLSSNTRKDIAENYIKKSSLN